MDREVYGMFNVAKDGPPVWRRTEEGMPEHQVNEMLETHPEYERARITITTEKFEMLRTGENG